MIWLALYNKTPLDAHEHSVDAIGVRPILLGTAIKPEFSVEITSRLLEMVSVETDGDWVANIIAALGHQEPQPRIFEALKSLAKHPYWLVRWHITLALEDFKTPESVEILIQFTTDAEASVRDWATFGLSHCKEFDSPAMRFALVARLEDEDAATRAEALYGLAELHDSRVVAAAHRELEGKNGHPKVFDVVCDTPGYRLLPALRAMEKDPVYQGDWQELRAAIIACETQLKENSDEI